MPSISRRRWFALALSVSLVGSLAISHCGAAATAEGDTSCPDASPIDGSKCAADANAICGYGCDTRFTCVQGQWTPFVVSGFQPSVSACPESRPEAGSPCDGCRADSTCSYLCPGHANSTAVCVGGAWEVDSCDAPFGDGDAAIEDASADAALEVAAGD